MKPEYTIEMQPLTSEDKNLLLKNFWKEKVIFWRIVVFYVFVVISQTSLDTRLAAKLGTNSILETTAVR
jgi:hypothetical protein